ncbi:MAG: hypothetical protein OXE99_05525 [Cellvibrionales bacterium]|nr:hypothetical protein [Cellvibrionales bacterium]
MKKNITLAALFFESVALASLPTYALGAGGSSVGKPQVPNAGFFHVHDSSYSFTVGGFTRLDALYTSNQIGDVEQFTTATIPVVGADGSKKINGEDYTPATQQIHFNAKRSRLWLEGARPFDNSDLKVKIEGDFWGAGHFRLRHAYGAFDNIKLGQGKASLLVGQTYSAFMVDSSQANVLDNQGPNSNMNADRHPLVTWTHSPIDLFTYRISIEKSEFDPTQSEVRVSGLEQDVQVAEYGLITPMFVSAVIIGNKRQNIQFSAAYARIETKVDLGGVQDKTIDGYGFNMGGLFSFGERDFVRYYAVYTDGLGLLIPDLETGYSDGVYGLGATTDEIVTLDSFGGYISLQHLWSETLSSNLVWSYVKVNNSVGQPDWAYKDANYVAANLIWKPAKQLMFGTEYLWGDRRNKDGSAGDASRVMISAQFNF